MSLLPHFHLILSGKMGCGPFRWDVKHCALPRVSCWANTFVAKKLGGAPWGDAMEGWSWNPPPPS